LEPDCINGFYKVFTPLPAKYTNDMLVPENIDDILVNVRTEFQQRHKQLLTLTANYHYELGQQIYKARTDLGFGGFLEMDINRLKGFIQAGGSWNEFNVTLVNSALSTQDARAPRMDYGVNNPNTGYKMHTWKVTGEYITMFFKYADEKTKDRIIEFFDQVFKPQAEIAKADSVRFEIIDYPNNHYSVELIMWWD
jgi:hypothetical protein